MADALSPIRVLFPFVGGDNLGGSHVSALGLICGLDRARYTPIVLLHNHTGPFAELLAEKNIPFETLPDVNILARRAGAPADGDPGDTSGHETGPLGYLLGSVPRMRRAILQYDAQIVHTNDGRMHVNWALPTRLSGRKMLWHHRQDPTAFGINKVAPLLADHIVSVSHFSRPRKPLRSVNGKFSVIRSPFAFDPDIPDSNDAHRAICAELGLAGDAVLLGYFGNLTPRKRPLHFVRVVAAIRAALHATQPERAVHGLIFGETVHPHHGLDQEALALADALGLGGAIHLMGFRSPIAPYMAGVDAALVTAYSEPFGRTLIEAMHLGTPVVATDHGGNPEAIEHGENGYLVDPEDPGAFVPPIMELLQQPDRRRRIIIRARDGIVARYGAARHIAEISAVYNGLAGP